jgi:hypothetical protein
MALDDLLRYESAAVAEMNVEKDKGLALLAIENQYRVMLGKDFDSDPVMKHSFGEASNGGEKYGITNVAIAGAIENYSQKYNISFASTKFSDLIKYLTEGFSISEEAQKALSVYKDTTLVDLAKTMKDEQTPKEAKEAMQKALQALEMLKERRLRAKTMEIYNGVVKRNLESLYPKEEKKEDGKGK